MGWLMIGLLALITFFNRFAFFSRLTRYQPGAEMGAFLSFSAQSVLTAIWLPIVFSYEPGHGLDWDPDYLAATLLVTVLTLLRLPTLVVVVVGMGGFFLLRLPTLVVVVVGMGGFFLLRWLGGVALFWPW